MDRDRTFDWAIVDDLDDGELDDGELENGDGAGPSDPADDPRRVRNVRRLVVACIVGGVAILMLGIVGVVVVVHELDQRPTAREKLTTSIHDRYQSRYDDCIAGGSGQETCSPKITQQCANDARWMPKDVDELSDVCSFGKP